MDNTTQIRLVEEKDLQALAKVYCKVYENNEDENWSEDSAYKLLSQLFKTHPGLAFVAEHECQIVGGFLAGIKPWWDGNHLVDGEIFVDPAYETRGIGTALSKALYHAAKDKYAAKCIDGITFRKAGHPLDWYKKQGFEEVAEWIVISGDLETVLSNLEKSA